FQSKALHPVAFIEHPQPPARQNGCRYHCGGQPPPLGIVTVHRTALLTSTYMTVRPVVRLANARPIMKRPRESNSSDCIRLRFITYITPPTTNGKAANIIAETCASADSARALSRIDLRARMTAPRLPNVSARLPPVFCCSASV